MHERRVRPTFRFSAPAGVAVFPREAYDGNDVVREKDPLVLFNEKVHRCRATRA